jgi:hypothetical protein
MAYEKRDGDIAVFMERDKKNEKAPDWKGEALIDGVTYEVAFWPKGSNGTMLAGSIKVKGQRQNRPAQDFRGSGSQGVSGNNRNVPDLDDEIPF